MNQDMSNEEKKASLHNDLAKANNDASNSEIVLSDKVKSIKKKKKKKIRKKPEPIIEEHPLEKFGKVRKTFIMEHIRTIDYIDIAYLVGVKSEKLKEAVEKMGIKLPIDRARKWSEIDVGKFRSLTDCARCRVQHNHSSFLVGIPNCRKCYEKNIKHWVEINEFIKLKFSHED